MTRPMPLEQNKTAWITEAVDLIEDLARESFQRGTTFTADDLRKRIVTPDHPSWVGAAFSTARARGIAVTAGYGYSSARSRHGGVLHRWQAAGNLGVNR